MKKLSVIIIQMIIAISLLASNSYAQSGKDAFKALKKVEAKVEMGISYKNYREALGDANVELKMFLESPSAKKSPNLASSLKKTMEHYKNAADLWAITVETDRVPFFSPNDQPYLIGYELTNELFKKYPKAVEISKEVGRSGKSGEEAIDLSTFLSVIWSEASKELQRASSYLK